MRSVRRALATGAGVVVFVVAMGIAEISAQTEWKAPPEAKNLRNPQPPTTTSIANGKKLAKANCVSCHGPKGKGDGPAAAALPPPKPADWTSPKVTAETDGELFWKISNGRGAMPPWKHLHRRRSADGLWPELVDNAVTMGAWPISSGSSATIHRWETCGVSV